MFEKIIQLIKNNLELAFVFLFALGIIIYVKMKQDGVDKSGIITVAKVTNFSGSESGSDLYIDIYLKGKIYSTAIGYGCRASCIGKFFFIKVNKENPADYPLFYGEQEVPRCIIDSVKYYGGWDTIPSCRDVSN